MSTEGVLIRLFWFAFTCLLLYIGFTCVILYRWPPLRTGQEVDDAD